MVNRLATFQTFPLFLDLLPMAILFGLLAPSPWYSHLCIQIFIQTHFFPSHTRLWNSLPPDVSAVSTLPAFKRAIVYLF